MSSYGQDPSVWVVQVFNTLRHIGFLSWGVTGFMAGVLTQIGKQCLDPERMDPVDAQPPRPPGRNVAMSSVVLHRG